MVTLAQSAAGGSARSRMAGTCGQGLRGAPRRCAAAASRALPLSRAPFRGPSVRVPPLSPCRSSTTPTRDAFRRVSPCSAGRPALLSTPCQQMDFNLQIDESGEIEYLA